MNLKACFYFLLSLLLLSCNNSNREENKLHSENDVDATRNFVRAALDGRWKDARNFMLPDSTNTQLLDAYENNYRTHMSAEDKRDYRNASILLYDLRKVNDSVTIVTYANSFKKQKDSLKAVLLNNQWLVDLKYSFPQTDTSNYVH